MKKKTAKAIKPVNSEVVLQRYLTVLHYAANGEGQMIEINVCFADCDATAKEKHLDRFYPNATTGREYFGQGVDVMTLDSKPAKKLLADMFRFGRALHDDLTHGSIEFYFKYYVNLS